MAGRLLLPALLALLVSACGTTSSNDFSSSVADSPTEPEVAETPPSTTPTTPLSDRPPDDPLCPVPLAPFYREVRLYAGDTEITGTPAEPDESIDLLARAYEPPDTDGDGSADVVTSPGDGTTVVVDRGDGELVLARPQGVVGLLGGRSWVGDLDGDGRDEVLVYATPDEPEGPLLLIVVPGTVETGRHDPVEVGVTLPPEALVAFGLGDHDDDGADDLALAGPPVSVIASGRELLAAGAGAALSEIPVVVRPVTSPVAGVLELSPDEPPALVEVAELEDGNVQLSTLDGPALSLRTTGEANPFGGGWAGGSVGGFVSAGDRIVVYSFDGGRDGITAQWMWNLDAPCD